MKLKKEYVLRRICGENIIVAEGKETINFGELIHLNDTAAWLWEQAQEEFTPESLAKSLCEEYEVDAATAMHDVSAILEKWQQAGFLE